VIPTEWFLVPVFVIDEIVERTRDESIGDYFYDPNAAELRISWMNALLRKIDLPAFGVFL
jgi:hypothetical protein